MKYTSLGILLIILLAAAGCKTTAADDRARAEELVDLSGTVLKRFLADPANATLKDTLTKCRGVIIFPSSVKGGLLMGASGGGGVLLSRDKEGSWSNPSFCQMHSLSFGPQAGFQSVRLILALMTDQAVTRVLEGGLDIGTSLSSAAGTKGTGKGASSRLQSTDVVYFVRGEGAYGGIVLQGGVLNTEQRLNDRFYAKGASPLSIVVERKHTNPAADALIEALTEATKG